MWSRVILCLFVGLAYASHSPGWKVDKEYLYTVHGRTLALLSEESKQNSGILFNATLRIQPITDGKLLCEIRNPIYSQVLTTLPESNVPFPRDSVSWKPLEMSSKPFEVEMNNGVITNLIVSKDIENWEANMIKSIISQFQLNTNGKNVIKSPINILPKDGENSATFKVMEDTVTGHTETLYSINQLPRYVVHSRRKWNNNFNLHKDEPIIEIVKHKNYSNYVELPSYISGFRNLHYHGKSEQQLGNFMSRAYVSNALVTGNLKDFIVETTSTTEVVAVKPLLSGKETSSVVSYIQLHLSELTDQKDRIPAVQNPYPLGNLVYSYGKSNSDPKVRGKDDSQQNSDSSEMRHRYLVEPSPLDQPPQTPLLPFHIGYRGMSINNKIDIVKQVIKHVKQIANDIHDSSHTVSASSLHKYTDLVSLIRLMNPQELKQAFKELYSTEEKGVNYASWGAFRDAVGESGTGPALITIRDWMLSEILTADQIENLIGTITEKVRQPTVEFLRTMFDLVKSEQVNTKWPCNDTALISYTTLIRKVYTPVQRRADMHYAANSFGSFNTEEGRTYVETTVIPYFIEQLNYAVSDADSQRIHTYIRSLGNIAHPKILGAFEPYLEGEKKCSQFQRMLMIVSMDKLAGDYPEIARSVLYRVYRNIGDSQEIRVAAFYQLMRTNVPADMLKSIAIYTNIDQHEHVNAAVKSVIEGWADLKYGFIPLSQAARDAKPFLTPKKYGANYGKQLMRDQFYEQLELSSQHNIEYISSENTRFPMKMQYALDYALGGLVDRVFSIQGLISSFEQLLDILEQQTRGHQDQMNKQQQHYGGRQESIWSSHNIAKLLNMTSEEHEQLEVYLHMKMNGYLQTLSFNNQSFEQLPLVVRYLEEILKGGQKFYSIKIRSDDMKVSFPTVTGLPFVYAYDLPSVFRIDGNIKASAHPEISQDNKLVMPDRLKMKVDTRITTAAAYIGSLSFTTPFDHQVYICGFKKDYQSHLPVRVDLDVGIKNMQLKLKIQPKDLDTETRFFHYSALPFTSRIDLLNSNSVIKGGDYHKWRSENMRKVEATVGEETTGVAMRVEMEYGREHWSLGRMMKSPLETILGMYHDQNLQRTKMNLYLVPSQSSSNLMVLHLGYKDKSQEEPETGSQKRSSENSEPVDRLERVMRQIMAGIKTGRAQVVDACVEFQGSKSTNYSITSGYGKRWDYPANSSWVVLAGIRSSRRDQMPFEVTLESKNSIYNISLLQPLQALNSKPTILSEVEITFGEDPDDLSRIQGKVEFSRSTERKEYLQRQPFYEKCIVEMDDDNTQLPACMELMLQANMLDRVNMSLQATNLSPENQHMLEHIKSSISQLSQYCDEIEESEQPKLYLQARFDPDLGSVNVSSKFQNKQYTIENIALGEYASEALVLSTYVSIPTRIGGKAMGLSTYRPMCVVDRNKISNFNNVTFPADLTKDWTLMFQYVPYQSRQGNKKWTVEEQLKSQIRNYAVFVRETEDLGREVKITMRSPATDYEVMDLTLKPGAESPKVFANGKEVMRNEKSKSIWNGYVLMNVQPTGELLVSISNKFLVVYDGKFVRIGLKDYLFRNSGRGICGQVNQEMRKDFLTPQNCIARDYKKFMKTYELSQEGKMMRQKMTGNRLECAPQQEIIYADVISEQEVQRGESGKDMGDCTRFQTLYTENESEICFTTRPMPVCKSRCQSKGSMSKKVSVHCISVSPVARMWKTQIDKGASPDFSHKETTKTVSMQLPKKCFE